MERGGGDAARTGRRDLVLHEGDEGRDHDGEAAQREGGHLKADRLAGARGQDAEHVASGEHGGDDVTLARPEGAVAEMPLEESAGQGERCHAAAYQARPDGAVPGARRAAPRSAYPPPAALLGPARSSTSRTRRSSVSGVNGFWRNAVSGSSRP